MAYIKLFDSLIAFLALFPNGQAFDAFVTFVTPCIYGQNICGFTLIGTYGIHLILVVMTLL